MFDFFSIDPGGLWQAARKGGGVLMPPMIGLAMLSLGWSAGQAEEAAGRSAAAHAAGVAATVDRARDTLDPLRLTGEQAMWAALSFEDVTVLRRLLRFGVDPNKPEDLSLMTPLMASETHDLAATLLEAGADTGARDRHGRTALHHAVRMREGPAIIPLLIRHGADVNARTTEGAGATPLFTAVEYYIEHQDHAARGARIIRLLVEAGADINAVDAHGDTVLALAVVNKDPALVKILLSLGADAAKPLKAGKTALDYAREGKHADMVTALEQAAAGQVPTR